MLLRECGTAIEGKLRRSSNRRNIPSINNLKTGYMTPHSIPELPGLVAATAWDSSQVFAWAPLRDWRKWVPAWPGDISHVIL